MGVAFLAALLVSAAFTHVDTLLSIPYRETDEQIAAGLKMGREMNVLNHYPPPRAGGTAAPLANADTLSSRAYLDLSLGPMALQGLRPDLFTYWSASVFAHNTDTVFVLTDRETPERRISIGMRLKGQSCGATTENPVGHDAILPSATAVLLIHCFMSDRTNTQYISDLTGQQKALTLRPASVRRPTIARQSCVAAP
jgi:uncharacterized membrane protein